MIENTDGEQIERLNSRVIELLRERDALVKDLAEAVRLLYALLGLELGSGKAALAFIERHNGVVGGSNK